jgi:hypothetical protein
MRRNRNQSGQSIAEVPAALYVLFVLLAFPMIDLAAVGLRYTFCTLAVDEAAGEAAMCKTFMVDSSKTDPSAQTAAQQTINRVLSKFNGLTKIDFKLRLVTTRIDNGMTTRQETPLAKPADTNTNVYVVEPELVADVQPLVTMPFFNLNIPGITGPLRADVTARKYCENPQGLNQ